jgi:Uma2 family endonuclease
MTDILATEATPSPPTKRQSAPAHPAKNGNVPSLESGDRLSRIEFERRYAAHPEILKAELIEGVVYVASPVRVRLHGAPHSRIIGWLIYYQAVTPDVNVADNSTLRLDLDNEPQPDVAVWLEGGNAFVGEDDYLRGAPELIVEVAGSSAAIDLYDKLIAYRRNDVQEYLVLLTHEQAIRWYRFQGGESTLIEPGEDGILRSQVFPGLWLHGQRFWEGDLAGVLAVLQQGIESAEHAVFVQQRQ